MTRIFLTVAGFDAVALLAAVVVGVLSKMHDGVLHPEDPTYMIHFVLGLTAALGNLLVHCLIMTYFLGTGRWVKEVTLAYDLPDERWARPTRDLKRRNTPLVILAMLVTIAATAAGEGSQHQVWPWWIHLALACVTLIVNGWVFGVEYRNLTVNARILEEVMNEAERIRAERGLPSSAEALGRSEGQGEQ